MTHMCYKSVRRDSKESAGSSNVAFELPKKSYLKCAAYVSLLIFTFLTMSPSPTLAKEGKSDRTANSETKVNVPSKRLERIMVERLLLETNRARSKAGLAPMTAIRALNDLATIHSRNMCLAGELKHESDKYPPGWRTFDERMKRIGFSSGAENLAYRSYSGNPMEWADKVVAGWLHSPEHRKNILDPNYKYVGIGVFLCNNGVAFATQVFSSQGVLTGASVYPYQEKPTDSAWGRDHLAKPVWSCRGN